MDKQNESRKISDFLGMGTLIGFGAAIGVLLGAIMGNIWLWLSGGAAIGVVVGAIVETAKRKKRNSV